jgi:predicted Zn-dependent peptidase
MYLEYSQKYYSPNTSHLIIISPDTSPISLEESTISPFPQFPSLPIAQSKNILISDTSTTLEIILGYALPYSVSNHTRKVAAVLKTSLANFWTSVLLVELRIKHNFIYWINSYSILYPNSIALTLYYKIERTKLLESLQIIHHAINNLESLITPEDIERYKTIFISDSKAEDNNIYDIQPFYGFQLQYPEGITETPQDYYVEIQSVTYEEVIDLMREFLNSTMKSLVIKGQCSSEEWDMAQKYI